MAGRGFCDKKCDMRNGVWRQDEENENEELDAENVEGKLAWQGGRAEEATYEEGDAEDAALSAAARAQAAKEAGDPEVRQYLPPLAM